MLKRIALGLMLALTSCLRPSGPAGPAKRAEGAVPDAARMRQIYEEVKTPFKYGVVLRGEEGAPVDCPSVFRHGGRWYMVYICMNKTGYETHLAESPDLLHWRPLGKILPFRGGDAWDANQAGGYIALQDTEWGGSASLGTYDDRYWLSYLGGALEGYETDPLAIGMAWTKDSRCARRPGTGCPSPS